MTFLVLDCARFVVIVLGGVFLIGLACGSLDVPVPLGCMAAGYYGYWCAGRYWRRGRQ